MVRSIRVLGILTMLAVPTLLLGAPAAASCIPLADLLPEPGAPGYIVFTGTVVGSDELTTDLVVDGYYLGQLQSDLVTVVGGREPGVITSVDWMPVVGERYVVVAEQSPDGTLTTAPCQQSEPYPDQLLALEAKYGEPVAPPSPVVTSNESPLPGSLVHGTPPPA